MSFRTFSTFKPWLVSQSMDESPKYLGAIAGLMISIKS